MPMEKIRATEDVMMDLSDAMATEGSGEKTARVQELLGKGVLPLPLLNKALRPLKR